MLTAFWRSTKLERSRKGTGWSIWARLRRSFKLGTLQKEPNRTNSFDMRIQISSFVELWENLPRQRYPVSVQSTCISHHGWSVIESVIASSFGSWILQWVSRSKALKRANAREKDANLIIGWCSVEEMSKECFQMLFIRQWTVADSLQKLGAQDLSRIIYGFHTFKDSFKK